MRCSLVACDFVVARIDPTVMVCRCGDTMMLWRRT
jgi:hypothetical protein